MSVEIDDYDGEPGPQTYFAHDGRIAWSERFQMDVVICHESTNDNDDDGYSGPDDCAHWEITVRPQPGETLRAAFLRHAGGPARCGLYGQPVDVVFEGRMIEREA